jgi:hypothetical protein
MTIYLDPFPEFTSNLPPQHRRRITLAELVKPRAGYEWAAILTDAYLSQDGIEKVIGSFNVLTTEIGARNVLEALDTARRSGRFTEGRKVLPQATVRSLQRFGVEPFWIRSLDDSCKEVISAQRMVDNIISTSRAALGDFALCDTGATWYLRFRDDDPLLFLFAESTLLGEVISEAPENVFEVSRNFIYAY